jgi:predicted TIM-barrel enzyme
MSLPYVDVLCTSGPGTGYAADVEKVRALRAGLGDHAMALASGVTPENVRIYLPYVQAFLVGTGIERQLGVLDPAKIEALLKTMQAG